MEKTTEKGSSNMKSKRVVMAHSQYIKMYGRTGVIINSPDENIFNVRLDGGETLLLHEMELYFPELNTYNQPCFD